MTGLPKPILSNTPPAYVVDHLTLLRGLAQIGAPLLGYRPGAPEGEVDDSSGGYGLSVIGEAGELVAGLYTEAWAERGHNVARLTRHLLELDVQSNYLLADWRERRNRLYKTLYNSMSVKPRLVPEDLVDWLDKAADGAKGVPDLKEMMKSLSRESDYDTYRLLSMFSHPGYAHLAFAVSHESEPEEIRAGRLAAGQAVSQGTIRISLTVAAGCCLSIFRPAAGAMGFTDTTRDKSVAEFGFDVLAELDGATTMLQSIETRDAGDMDR